MQVRSERANENENEVKERRKTFQAVSVISLGWNCREGELKKEGKERRRRRRRRREEEEEETPKSSLFATMNEAKRDRSARAQPTTNNYNQQLQPTSHNPQQHTHRQQHHHLPTYMEYVAAGSFLITGISPSSLMGYSLSGPHRPTTTTHDRRHNKYGIPNACKRCHPDHNCIGTIPHTICTTILSCGCGTHL